MTSGCAALEGPELGWSSESSAVDAVVAVAGPMDLAKTCSDHESSKTLEALLLGAGILKHVLAFVVHLMQTST